MIKRKHIIIYKDWTIWKNDNERKAIAKLDSDTGIIAAFAKTKGWSYTQVMYDSHWTTN